MKNLPFERSGKFYRGNLHTHSTNSDGSYTPDEVCRRYQEAGYDFIALSEHFMERFDFPVSDTRPFRNDDFTTLVAAELHQGKITVGETWHILALGIPVDFAPPTHEESALQIAERAAKSGAFIGLVHPSWYGLTIEDAKLITCAHGVEVYNHSSHVEVDRGEDWAFCDQLLNEGWRLSGFASDDAHRIDDDAFGGWVNVHAQSLDSDLLLEALKAGNYYSSQGPEIHDIKFKKGEILIACSPAATVSLQGQGAISSFVHGNAMTKASFPIKRFEKAYVRVTIRDARGRRAWSNPIWFD